MQHNTTQKDHRIKLCPTKDFYVYSWDENCINRSVGNYIIHGDYSLNKNTEKQVTSNLTKYGCCVRSEIIPLDILKRARTELKSFAKKLISTYDELDDEFVDVDTDDLCIERMPRIGRGKHNIHFDPLVSSHHQTLAELAKASFFSDALSKYMGKLCSLRETGISLTRPRLAHSEVRNVANNNINDTKGNKDSKEHSKYGDSAGEGMEWHSDGAQGEATVLMSVEDVDEALGALRVIPKSHLLYVPGVGHTEVEFIS